MLTFFIGLLATGGAVLSSCIIGAYTVPADYQEQDKKFRHLHK